MIRPSGAVTFAFVADPQLGAFAAHSGFSRAELDRYERLGISLHAIPRTAGAEWEVERLAVAVEQINLRNPDFVVVGGDMTHEHDSARQRQELRKVIAGINEGIRVHWVCGNHDVSAYPYRPTRGGLAAFRKNYGRDLYSIDAGQWRLIVLNTCVLDAPDEIPSEYVDQLAFLDATLEGADGRLIGLLGHHPLFLQSPSEPDSIWNVNAPGRHEILKRVKKFGIRFALAGHRHRNSTARVGSFEMITSAAVGLPFGTDPSGLRFVTLAKTITHEYVALEGVPAHPPADAPA